MKKLFDTNLPNVKYLLTDNKKNEYVEEWVWNACSLASKEDPTQLADNPFTYDRMIDYDRDYTALYLVDDKPTYGYFFKKTPQVDIRVMRKLRAYNTDKNKFSLGIKFWKLEADNFKNNLKPFCAEQGIDTIYFTRHVEAKNSKSEWRSNRVAPKFGWNIYGVYNVKLKGFLQNIHYYNTNPSERIHDHSFVLNFHKV